MTSSRWVLSLFAIGSLCIAVAFAMPTPHNPRLDWTDEKSTKFHETNQEIHSLSHSLADAASHATDPTHVHTPAESTNPVLTALELEKVQERSATLHEQLEAARQVPAGWNLLLGVVGGFFLIVGVVVAFASRAKT